MYIVFDFATSTMIDGIKHVDLAAVPPMARPSLERFLDLIKDEPWLFGFPVGGEEGFLAEHGLTLREVLTIGSEEAAAAAPASPEQREQIARRMREQERRMAYRIAEARVGAWCDPCC